MISPESPQVPAFWKRVLLMPFVPSLWVQARFWTLGAVVLPLFVSAALWSGALATYRGFEARGLVKELAQKWDERFDPLIIENGEARVEGSRLPEDDSEGRLFLVDPEETRPTPTDRQYIVVRKRSIIRSDGPPVDLKQVQGLFGDGPLRFDSASVMGWLQRWGPALQGGMFVLLVGLEWAGTVLGLLYGLIVGAVLMSLFGKSRALTGEGCTRIGVAVMSVKPVLGVGLALLGSSLHVCLGLLVWPALGVALGAFALSRLPASS